MAVNGGPLKLSTDRIVSLIALFVGLGSLFVPERLD
jgi:hypothetical protein